MPWRTGPISTPLLAIADELIVHGEVNLGIAVDLDFEGLLVPVVHRAEEKRPPRSLAEIAGLASRARPNG